MITSGNVQSLYTRVCRVHSEGKTGASEHELVSPSSFSLALVLLSVSFAYH